MNNKLGKLLTVFILLGVLLPCRAADMSVQLTTTDGSTKFSIQNSAATEVASVDSHGSLTVAGIVVAGTGANPITTAAGLLDATKLTGNLPALNGSSLTNLTGANV